MRSLTFFLALAVLEELLPDGRDVGAKHSHAVCVQGLGRDDLKGFV